MIPLNNPIKDNELDYSNLLHEMKQQEFEFVKYVFELLESYHNKTLFDDLYINKISNTQLKDLLHKDLYYDLSILLDDLFKNDNYVLSGSLLNIIKVSLFLTKYTNKKEYFDIMADFIKDAYELFNKKLDEKQTMIKEHNLMSYSNLMPLSVVFDYHIQYLSKLLLKETNLNKELQKRQKQKNKNSDN